MVRKLVFEEYLDLAKYIYERQEKYLDDGSEGTVYKGADGFAYKLMYEEPWISDIKILNPDEIITIDDINLKSFAFPIELYLIDGKVMGSKMKYVRPSIVSNDYTLSPVDFYNIDIYQFYKAYEILLEDVKKLSDMNILMFDVANNLMYDGKTITIVDTHYYTREDYNTYEKNLHIVEQAVKAIFDLWLDSAGLEEVEIENHNMIKYLEDVFDKMSELNKDEKFFFEQILRKKF